MTQLFSEKLNTFPEHVSSIILAVSLLFEEKVIIGFLNDK